MFVVGLCFLVLKLFPRVGCSVFAPVCLCLSLNATVEHDYTVNLEKSEERETGFRY